MTPLHGIACFYDVGFGARAVSRKTPIYFMIMIMIIIMIMIMNLECFPIRIIARRDKQIVGLVLAVAVTKGCNWGKIIGILMIIIFT